MIIFICLVILLAGLIGAVISQESTNNYQRNTMNNLDDDFDNLFNNNDGYSVNGNESHHFDPYDMNNYENPIDFYDDQAEEFSSYEEAEDFFEEHNVK